MKEQNIILFLGDIMLGENVYHYGRGIRTKYSGRFAEYIPDEIRDTLFKGVSAVFLNFEYALMPDTCDFSNFDEAIYSSSIETLNVLPKDMLKIVNVSNNHLGEKGEESAKFTVDTLKKHGYIVVGEGPEPVSLTINGVDYKIWGTSVIKNQFGKPVFGTTYDNLLDKLDLPSSKESNEKWIMSIHWGTEFIPYPDKQQVDLAHKLVDSGFDIVHGHHPHVFQPLEKYKKGLIMYSMGNFVFDENFAIDTQRHCCPLKVDGV